MAIKTSDQISIIDVTDAYSVILTSGSYTFPGTTDAAKAGSTCTTQILAYRGPDQIPASVTVGNVTCPTGVTVKSDGNATAPTLTFTASASFKAPGVAKIPVSLENGVTITREFAMSIAFTGAIGATGNGVESIQISYQAGTSATAQPTGTWLDNPPEVAAGEYLWTRMVLIYTDGSEDDPVYSVAQQGKDPITMSITSSAGTIFKNSEIATTLTAHVYVGGVEVSGDALSALGTIRWYRDGGEEAEAEGAMLEITAGEVTGKASYIAQLEA